MNETGGRNGDFRFPWNRSQRMALLWVQSQDLSGKSAVEIDAMYEAAYNELQEHYKKIRCEKQRPGWKYRQNMA